VGVGGLVKWVNITGTPELTSAQSVEVHDFDTRSFCQYLRSMATLMSLSIKQQYNLYTPLAAFFFLIFLEVYGNTVLG